MNIIELSDNEYCSSVYSIYTYKDLDNLEIISNFEDSYNSIEELDFSIFSTKMMDIDKNVSMIELEDNDQ